MAHKKAIVVGSGLSGMAAAMDLSDAGYMVHILEDRGVIGGRTSSWNEKGMMVESGLHRFLGFYSALPKLLERAGINLDELLCWEDEIEIRTPQGDNAVFAMSVHKPLKTLASMLGNNDFLSVKDKAAVAAMFTAGIKDYELHPDMLDTVTVFEYATQHGVTEEALVRLLKPLTEGIFFVPIDDYSAYNFFGLFTPFLPRIAKTRVGAFMGGMSEIMMQPLAQYVTDRGGQITVGAKVDAIETKRGKVTGVRVDDTFYEADVVVLAASLQGAKDIISRSITVKDKNFENLLKLPTMPAVTFQIELTEPSMNVDRTTFGPLTSLASFAEQSRTTFRASSGRLSAILTPPEKYLEMDPESVLHIVIKDAARLGVHLEDKIQRYHKVDLPHDFYSLAPGSEPLRPTQKTSIKGLALAGDYTKQKHLATMEGAVVAGHAAAALLID